MDYVFVLLMSFVILVWTIRPLYNFFAKNKYVLMDDTSKNVTDGIKSGLPAVAFYIILIMLFLYPARTQNIINSFESGSVIVLQLVIIFALSRLDKRQTKYEISEKGISFRRNFISWDEQYEIKYKKTFLFVLHKPRFILRSKDTKIVIPLLSKNINKFIDYLMDFNVKEGPICYDIYKNNKLYYVENRKLARALNKLK